MPNSTTPERRTEAVCPPWCAGHDDEAYQLWDEHGRGHGIYRNHASTSEYLQNDWTDPTDPDPRPVPEVGVALFTMEPLGEKLLPAGVRLYAEGDVVLTPAAARRLADLILRAADRAEASR